MKRYDYDVTFDGLCNGKMKRRKRWRPILCAVIILAVLITLALLLGGCSQIKKAGVNRPYKSRCLVFVPYSSLVRAVVVSIIVKMHPPSVGPRHALFSANPLDQLSNAFRFFSCCPHLKHLHPVTFFQRSHDSVSLSSFQRPKWQDLPLSLYTLYHIIQESQVKNYFVISKYQNTPIVDTS